MYGFINSYTTSPKLEAICHLRSTSTRSSTWQLSFCLAVFIVPLETSQIGLFCFCLSANDCTPSSCYVYSMTVGRYWLYKLRYLHFNITSMILGYFFSGEYFDRILNFPNNLFECFRFFSAALSVKMSILLYLPGLLVILFKRKGLFRTGVYMVILVMTQIFFAVPFLMEDARAYAHSAFNLGRVFLYKWTVNWRFIEEDVFLSSRFAITLLVGHATVLILFGLFKWCERDGGVYRVLSRGIRMPLHPAALDKVDADCEHTHIYMILDFRANWTDSIDVATVLFTSNLIGILFSRSLHYQFYSWYAQQIPFLAWRTCFPLPVK